MSYEITKNSSDVSKALEKGAWLVLILSQSGFASTASRPLKWRSVQDFDVKSEKFFTLDGVFYWSSVGIKEVRIYDNQAEAMQLLNSEVEAV